MRSALAKARDEWMASEEGMACAKPHDRLNKESGRQYLENRLKAAFLAGAKAAQDIVLEASCQASRAVLADTLRRAFDRMVP